MDRVEETQEVVRVSLLRCHRARGLRMVAALSLTVSACAATGQTVSTPIQTTEQSAAIRGVVLNAATNRPLARALVQVEGQAILTQSDGRFQFSDLNGTTTTVRVTKPGFYPEADPSQSATKPATVGSPDDVQIKLYPEALLTGTVSAPDGDPLAQVQVRAMRRTDDEFGSQWTMGGQTSTNADGQFRLPLPGGEYILETQYRPERSGIHGAVLPVMVPASGSSASGNAAGGASTLRLRSGSEQHFDLHPPVRPSHTVHIQVDSTAGAGERQFGPQIQVHLANGLAFSVPSRPSEKSGEVVLSLPNGSYVLSASVGLGEEASYGETRVTVADEDVTGVEIHLQKALELTVETSIDPNENENSSSIGTAVATLDPGTLSFVQQLGIFLQRTNSGVNLGIDRVSPMTRHGGSVGMTLLPGRYRLRTMGYSPWFIESATAGGTDLLTQELVVDGGSSSLPLRLVVSNATGSIKGTTRLGGQVETCYVYLIATAPSASPVIHARSGSNGSFAHAQIPPGSYRVLASEIRLPLDLTDPAVQRRFAPSMKTVTVSAGETGNVDLDAVPASELIP